MTCSIVLQINSAGFECCSVQHCFQKWRSVKASWPYFFLLDAFCSLSSYHSHLQVQRWRRMGEDDARRGFTRREIAWKILGLAVFDNINRPRRAGQILYPGYLHLHHHLVSIIAQVGASMGDFWRDSCRFSHRFQLCNRVNNLRHRHTSQMYRISLVCAEPGNVHGACIGCFLPVTRWGIAWIPKAKPEIGRKWTTPSIVGRQTQAQRLLTLDFVHQKGSVRFVDLLQVPWLIAVRSMLLNLVFWENYGMSSISLTCNDFATLTQDIVTRPPFRL